MFTFFSVFGYVVRGEDGVFNRGDPLLTAWILAWNQHQLSTDPLRLFQANIFYPFTDTLAYSEHIVAPALLAAPLRFFTANPIAVQNGSLVTAFVVLGVAAFLFFRWMSGNSIAAACGAILVTLSPVRMPQLGHIQLLHTAGLPILLYGLWRHIERPRVGAALLFFAGFLFEALTSFYLAFMALLCAAILVAVAALSLGPRRVLRPVALLLPGTAVTGLLLLLFFAPYWRLRDQLGFVRSLEGQWGNWASHKAYARPFPGSGAARLFPTITGTLGSSLYLGILTTSLAAAALFWLKRRRDVLRSRQVTGVLFFTALGVLAFLLSLGAWRELGGGRRLLLPFYYLHKLPGIDGLRATIRFSILVDFALVGLAVLGLAHVGSRLDRLPRVAGASAVAALGLFAFIERAPRLPLAPEESVKIQDEISHVYRALARDRDATVLELPMSIGPGPREGWDVLPFEQVYFSTVHWRPIVNGTSGYLPPGYEALVSTMASFPSREAVAVLRDLPINRVVVHRRLLRRPIDSSSFSEQEGFRILHECAEDLIVAVSPDTTPRQLLPVIKVLEEPRPGRPARVRLSWALDLPQLIYPPVRIGTIVRSKDAAGEERKAAGHFWLVEPRRERDVRVVPGTAATSLSFEVVLPDGQKTERSWNLSPATARFAPEAREGDRIP